ncbi:hypothetical protein G4W71_04915 [Clostridium botulinum]|uniref:hypothetical protein n=1 Tax=Clostridium botulinum TaxID=1491 RepID=UPI001788C639|nr:hypothetical protein [Clostridium botulinum]MBE1303381.1 hypothetical protein [Clostridium botulinum]
MIVNFTLNDSFFVIKSKRFEDIYDVLVNKKHIFKMAELFTLCAAIGFKNNRRIKIKSRGKEIRSEHFKENQLTVIYSIMINSKCINADLDNFRDYEFIKQAFKHLEEYAEGGMGILCEQVLKEKFNGVYLDDNYDQYEIDILRYIKEEQDNAF